MDDAEQSAGGSRIHRYGAPRERTPGEHPRAWEAIEAHVEQHLGPIESVYHEIASDYVHLDVLQVPAHDGRPYHMLVTCGMSARPMTVPVGLDSARHAELVIGLPADWPLDEESWRDERYYWPVRTLKMLARLPHAYDTFFTVGHTIPNGDPPEPYGPGTEMCCALIAPSLTLADDALLELDDGPLRFYAVVPLHRDEMDLKLADGMDALLDRLDAARVTEVLDAGRPSSVKRKRFGLF